MSTRRKAAVRCRATANPTPTPQRDVNKGFGFGPKAWLVVVQCEGTLVGSRMGLMQCLGRVYDR
jgi:hypothetical protein